MTERGMIFNAEMVRAILDGRKTQTRRIMKVQPESNQLGLLLITDSTKHSDIGKYHWAESNATGNHVRSKLFSCPFGAVGDRIWVRETWAILGNEDGCCIDWEEKLCKADERSAARIYRASCEQRPGNYGLWSIPDDADWKPHTKDYQYEGAWRPSIHMPRWASRILLEITDVRVERLNAISQEDAQAEGMELTGWRPTYSDPDSGGEVLTPYDNFAQLWASIYGDESWNSNPWVWVIEFKRVEGGAA
ncbi:TPA: hypothetical protein RUZ73_002080 [Klebsiella pneumoniae]|nr:hypothetical protein [Klebsiella pneumoniae]HDZ1350694.1 hypothetical protein [Klebsiella pneumoniae]HDZ9568270.1 hypothetical protein [Klebsiella pneumoniae]